MKREIVLTNLLSVIMLGATLISPTKANAQWIDLGKDALGQWGDVIRSNTVGRMAGQEFVGSLSKSEVEALKSRFGGDYHAKVTDWCNSQVVNRVGRNRAAAIVPGVSSTWRVENEQVNCYWRRFGGN